ncbi:MAG: nodulation protein NfeD [Solirubrobacterales bacterium]
MTAPGIPERRRPRRIGLAVAASALLLALAAGALALAATAGAGQAHRFAYSFELSGEISPATASWAGHALSEAADEGATVTIVRLDTPGGLDVSLREIVKDILAAPMPVLVYVSPDGARAASAGVYITQAGDVAAMAPQTNIGSATPIAIGPGSGDEVLGRKIRNDAAAYMRALAASHGRNPDLGERMVRRAVNVTAAEALAAGFIDFVAPGERALLRAADGFGTSGPKARVLRTAGLPIESHDTPLRYQLLGLLVNPTIAYLLLTVGLIGLGIELFSPGAVVPGVVGAISLLLGLYGTAQLPVNVAGVALLALAVALFVAEAHVYSHGVLAAGGIVALVLSGLLLFDAGGAPGVSVPAVIAIGTVLGLLLALVISRVARARREPVRTGSEELVGEIGEVRSRLDPEGQVFVEGALWRARLAERSGPLPAGGRVRVEAVEGLTLVVVPAGEADEGAEQWR